MSKNENSTIWDSKQEYYLRLKAGRVIGPIGIFKIAQLMKKGRIEGDELCRAKGGSGNNWDPMVSDPLLYELVMLQLEGKLELPKLSVPGKSSDLINIEDLLTKEQNVIDEATFAATEFVLKDSQEELIGEKTDPLNTDPGKHQKNIESEKIKLKTKSKSSDPKSEDSEMKFQSPNLNLSDFSNLEDIGIEGKPTADEDTKHVNPNDPNATVIDEFPDNDIYQKETMVIPESPVDPEQIEKDLASPDAPTEMATFSELENSLDVETQAADIGKKIAKNLPRKITAVGSSSLSGSLNPQFSFEREKNIKKHGYISSRTSKPKISARQHNVKMPLMSDKFRRLAALFLVAYLIFDFLDPDLPVGEKFREIKLNKVKFYIPKTNAVTNPGLSKELTKKGILYYRLDTANSMFKAASLFRQAYMEDRKNGQAIAFLGMAYARLLPYARNTDPHLGVISQLLTMAKGGTALSSLVAAMRAEIFLAFDRSDLSLKLIHTYQNTSELGPDHTYVYARALINERKYSDAMSYLSVFDNPQKSISARVRMLIAKVYEAQGKSQAALDIYTSILKIDSTYGPAWVGLANLSFNDRDLDHAYKYMMKATDYWQTLYPKDLAKVFNILGSIKISQNRPLEAEYFYRKSVILDFKNIDVKKRLIVAAKAAGIKENLHRRIYDELKIRDLISKASLASKTNRLSEAASEIAKAVEIAPNSHLPHKLAGEMYTEYGLLDSATRSFEKAYRLRKKDHDILYKFIESLLDSYRWKEARKLLAMARKMHPKRAKFYYLSGKFYQTIGKIQDAALFYTKSVQTIGLDSKSYFELSNISKKLRNMSEAEVYIRKSIESDPLNMDAHVAYAQLIADIQGDYTVPLGYLNEQLNKNTNDPVLLIAITKFNKKLGDQGAFLEYMKVLKQVASENWRYYKMRAEIAEDDGDYKLAMSMWKKMSDLNLHDPSGYLKRAQFYLEEEKFELAQTDLDTVENRISNWPGLNLLYAELLTDLGNTEGALERVTKESKAHPYRPEAFVIMGDIEFGKGNIDEAYMNYKKATELNQDYTPALVGSAKILRAKGNNEGSINLLRKAESIDSGNPGIARELGLNFIDQGRNSDAIQELNRYLRMNPSAKDRTDIRSKLNKL